MPGPPGLRGFRLLHPNTIMLFGFHLNFRSIHWSKGLLVGHAESLQAGTDMQPTPLVLLLMYTGSQPQSQRNLEPNPRTLVGWFRHRKKITEPMAPKLCAPVFKVPTPASPSVPSPAPFASWVLPIRRALCHFEASMHPTKPCRNHLCAQRTPLFPAHLQCMPKWVTGCR